MDRDAIRELALFVPNLVRLFAGLVRDARVPVRAKIVLGATAVYLASPIDLIPDFIPVLGSLDDAVIPAFPLRYVVRTTPAGLAAHPRPPPPPTLTPPLPLL